MPWLDLTAYVFGGAFLAKAVPHLVGGMMGRPFQSPFAKPPGQDLSSSAVNALCADLAPRLQLRLIKGQRA
jgi:hypothetical protein